MMSTNRISLPTDFAEETKQYFSRGCTVIYLAVNGSAAGYVVLTDTVRPESVQMIDRLQMLNVQPVLLTGDNENAAAAIASELHKKRSV